MVSMTVPPDAEGLLGRLEQAMSAFAAVPVGLRPGDAGDRIRGLHRLRARLDAELLAELAAFETSGGHEEAGCRTVGSWVRLHLLQTPTAAGGLVGVARALGGLSRVADAQAAGLISREHVDAIVAGVRRVGADRMARHEQTLVDLAAAASAAEVRAAVAEIVRIAETETGHDDTAEAKRAKAEGSRSFESRRVGDQLVVNAAVDLATGEALTGYIDAHSAPRPNPDGGTGGRDERTATQRRADAFCRLVDTATDAGDLPERVRSKAAVTLTVSLETLLGLPGAGPLLARLGVTPSQTARRLLCDGTLTRIILDPAGEPIDLNTRVRSHTTAQAKALATRHTRCVFPGCAVPFRMCHLHHIDHWADGGPTELANLVPLCGTHHRFHHEGGYTITATPGRAFRFHDPHGRAIPDPAPAAAAATRQLALDTDNRSPRRTGRPRWLKPLPPPAADDTHRPPTGREQHGRDRGEGDDTDPPLRC
ncbi:MAG: DUF222 domain-containing protein [Propionibacteriales bacterium]|nr:DUF222 domain-containing protein [Propionibacteriales bacterium]